MSTLRHVLILIVGYLIQPIHSRDLTPTIKELNAIFDEDLANFKYHQKSDLTLVLNETLRWQEVILPYTFDAQLNVGNCTIESAWQRLDRSVDVEIYGGDIAVVRTALSLNSPFRCRQATLVLDKVTKLTPITGQLSLNLDVSFSYIRFGDHLLHRTYVKPSLNQVESSYQIYETESFGKRINESLRKNLADIVDGKDKLLSALVKRTNEYDWPKLQESFKYTSILVERLINSQ